MGLDMYLELRKKFFKEIKSEEDYPKEKGLANIMKLNHNFNYVEKEERYSVGYWRKANAIHNFFIEECADGVDECQKIYVPLEKLEELLDKCKKIQKNPFEAEKILPTTEGFFFGSMEYGDWYYDDVEFTINLIKPIIEFLNSEEGKGFDIIYQASW